MSDKFRAVVFGKAGCDKCALLKKRVDELVARPEWADFEREYVDVETEEGMVRFCRAEAINPNRIPACLVQRQDASGIFRNMEKSGADGSVLLVQTDYSGKGRGVISPKMIEKLLEQARKIATPAAG